MSARRSCPCSHVPEVCALILLLGFQRPHKASCFATEALSKAGSVWLKSPQWKDSLSLATLVWTRSQLLALLLLW